jgi:hypothetical protein
MSVGVVQNSAFLDLPDEVLAYISQWAAPWEPFKTLYGHPLLKVSRDCRDAIFKGLSTVTLDLSQPVDPAKDSTEDANCSPTARLLNRICQTAQAGIELGLTLTDDHEKLCTLLQPALECRGWVKVRHLQVRLG